MRNASKKGTPQRETPVGDQIFMIVNQIPESVMTISQNKRDEEPEGWPPSERAMQDTSNTKNGDRYVEKPLLFRIEKQ